MIKLEQRRVLGRNQGRLGTFAGKIEVPGIQRLQIFKKAQIAANI